MAVTGSESGATVVEINFCKFVRVARVGGFLFVPSNGRGDGQRRQGVSGELRDIRPEQSWSEPDQIWVDLAIGRPGVGWLAWCGLTSLV